MHLIAVLVGCAALVVALLRWLRVAQREHYIPGACVVIARRWIVRRPENAGILAVGVIGVTIAFVSASDVGAAAAVVAGMAAAVFPFPMTVLGHDARLHPTRRALALGAVAALLAGGLIALAVAVGRAAAGASTAALVTWLVVDLAALLALPFERRAMEHHRARAEQKLLQVAPTVIAVTGSWGKTSTKNHIAALLAGSVSAVASPASFNNTGGLARTINDHMGPGCEVLVAEMGMYGPGEIRALCEWVRPDIAVICAVGPMHLERVGSMSGIVAAKAEILERARQAVLWVDQPDLRRLADGCPVPRVWRVGSDPAHGLDVEVRRSADRLDVYRGDQLLGSCPLAQGVHPENLGCAVAAVLAYGLDPAVVGGRVARLANPAHRATAARSDRGVWVIDDTFNSNPVGAARALETLVDLVPDGRRVVVTPGMVELGPSQDEENRRFAGAVRSAGATLLVVNRTNRRALLQGAADALCLPDRAAARQWVREHLDAGDGVLWENDLPDQYP